MKSSPSKFIRLDLRLHQASHATLYDHLVAIPPRLRSEHFRHLAAIGWLVTSGKFTGGFHSPALPTETSPATNKVSSASDSHPLDHELLAVLEDQDLWSTED